ncbi:hypothetical protein GCM10022224_088690 [Nonomuraea antimicrobica]|uniref:Uncharacterized protein n=1 Tax=Nonomuraea antimicrobica TaxID=561173 RepID=A0ABP7DUK5_9ACTN
MAGLRLRRRARVLVVIGSASSARIAARLRPSRACGVPGSIAAVRDLATGSALDENGGLL